jgi:phosphoglycolate phosphatase
MKLVIFDCDGTLVDSQNAIIAAMEHAFSTLGLSLPSRQAVLAVIGLSLGEVFAILAAEQTLATQAELARLYRTDFPNARGTTHGHDPLFAGTREAVSTLARRRDVVMGIATGKSRRGMTRLIAREGWHGYFHTIQTADDHPSKPHPSMILRAMTEAGAKPSATVMVGDTTYDVEMARNAGVGAIGVGWGYHPADSLVHAGAHAVAATPDVLLALIDARLAAQEATDAKTR